MFELQHFKVTPPLNDHIDISRQVAQTTAKLIPGKSNLEETKSIQAAAPELRSSRPLESKIQSA